MRNIIRKSSISKKALDVIDKHKALESPIKIEKIAINEGFTLIYKESDNLFGFLHLENDKKIIAYSSRPENVRTRFTIAHELGHYFLHLAKINLPHLDKSLVTLRDKSLNEDKEIMEIEANRFATEILMPETLIEKEISKINKKDRSSLTTVIKKLSDIFAVSQEMMTLRLNSLELISV